MRAVRPAIVGVDDSYCALIADRIERAGEGQPYFEALCACRWFYAAEVGIIHALPGNTQQIADLAGIDTLKGAHNAQNAAAAIAACLAVGVSPEEIRSGLQSFPGLKHRMQPVGRKGAVTFVNDSKATNAERLPRRFPAISGSTGSRVDCPRRAASQASRPLFSHIVRAYLIGEAAPEFASTLGEGVPYEIIGTLDRAVAHAAKDADADGGACVVMLSPACASFDQFRNFEVRGENSCLWCSTRWRDNADRAEKRTVRW